jgi:hypothetical protein
LKRNRQRQYKPFGSSVRDEAALGERGAAAYGAFADDAAVSAGKKGKSGLRDFFPAGRFL